MSLDPRQPRDPRFHRRVPLAERGLDAFSEPRPPASWQPAPKPPMPPPRPAMPPFEHEHRTPRLFAAAEANDLPALIDAATHPWAWHGDQLIRAAGLAARAGALDALTWLLDHGVAAAATTEHLFNREISVDVGSEPLMSFAAAGGVIAIAELLLARGASVGVSDGSGRTPMHEAAARGHAEMIRWLIRHGAEIDALAFDGTPLASAASCNHFEAARILLEAGADPHLKHGSCGSPIEQARAHPEITAILNKSARRA